MSDDRRARSVVPPDVLTDEEIGGLVRAVVDRWDPPPRRLDRPTWRDRTVERVRARSGGTREGSALGSGGLARAGARSSATGVGLAAILTAVLAVGAAIVGSRPDDARPTTPIVAADAPLPKLELEEAPPFERLVVRILDGGYQHVDLATGELVPSELSGWTSGGRQLFRLANGEFVCACVEERESVDGGSVTATLELRWYDATLAERRRSVVRELRAEGDREGSGPAIRIDVRAGVAGEAFLGWATTGRAGSTAGVDVIDLRSGRVLASTTLAPDPVPEGWLPGAPAVHHDPSGRRLLVEIADERANATPPRHRWLADVDIAGRRLAARPIPDVGEGGAGCRPLAGGFAADGGAVELCPRADGRAVVRRRGLDGSGSLEQVVPGWLAAPFAVHLADATARTAWIWSPDGDELARVDLAGLTVAETRLSASTGGLDPFAWLAPTAAAKVAPARDGASPMALIDGRLYVAAPAGRPKASPVAQLREVDATTLAVLATIDLRAPAVSLTSAAGGHLVVAGAPSLEQVECGSSPILPCAPGQVPDARSRRESSITVIHAATGRTVALAGRLGSRTLVVPTDLAPR
jgi:hypothetical protein